ncbi:MAG: hypothetical protein GY854_01715 [Deltaproteobacteria bacterium]|nr:hypothetical protein [Deltaproteobacteria bacterium]
MQVFLEGSADSMLGMNPIALTVVLLVAGLAFLALELFILPGFGVAGIIGILFLVGGSVVSWLAFGSAWGSIVIGGTVVLSIVLTVVGFRSRALRKRLVLDASLKHGGGTASEDMTGLVGLAGEARSDLRPAGIATVDDRRLDVVSEGGFIKNGTRVKVVGVDGPRVVVAKAE